MFERGTKLVRANQDLRKAFLNAGIKQYEVCKVLKISESKFSAEMRNELEEEDKKKIMEIIDRLAAEKEEMARQRKGVL